MNSQWDNADVLFPVRCGPPPPPAPPAPPPAPPPAAPSPFLEPVNVYCNASNGTDAYLAALALPATHITGNPGHTPVAERCAPAG